MVKFLLNFRLLVENNLLIKYFFINLLSLMLTFSFIVTSNCILDAISDNLNTKSLYYIKFSIFIVFFLILLLLNVAYFTLLERKVMGSMQRRKGPDYVGFLGLLQPFADALKLLTKELVIPKISNKFLFLLAPFLTLFISFLIWLFLPLASNIIFINSDYSLLFILALSSLGVYGIFLAGWSSNSNYAFLGSIRAVAQMISYEVCFFLLLFPIILLTGSLSLNVIVNFQSGNWFFFSMFPNAFLFFICLLAETNRAPFDLPEAEAELVAGYNVEYSSLYFAYFFLGEYTNILTMSLLYVLLFMGGWCLPFYSGSLNIVIYFLIINIKWFFINFLIIWVRATLPRIRYDNLMIFCWKICLPAAIGLFAYYLTLFLLFNFIW